MKNEDKIVELLAETLKKQDRHEEILGIHGKLLEKLVKGQDELVKGQKALIQEFHKMNDHLLSRQDKMEDRISRLEDKVFKGR